MGISGYGGWGGAVLSCDGAAAFAARSVLVRFADEEIADSRQVARADDGARGGSCGSNFIHLVTWSHNHTDRVDTETLGPLLHVDTGITLIVAEANRKFVAERLRIHPSFPVGLRIGQSTDAGPFRIEAVPAKHDELGPNSSAIVRFSPWTIYHSGDTLSMTVWLSCCDPIT